MPLGIGTFHPEVHMFCIQHVLKEGSQLLFKFLCFYYQYKLICI